MAAAPSDRDLDTLIALDDALTRLEREEERLARVVECRFFGGLSIPDTANALGVSAATVKRDWAVARRWLYRALEAGGGVAAPGAGGGGDAANEARAAGGAGEAAVARETYAGGEAAG